MVGGQGAAAGEGAVVQRVEDGVEQRPQGVGASVPEASGGVLIVDLRGAGRGEFQPVRGCVDTPEKFNDRNPKGGTAVRGAILSKKTPPPNSQPLSRRTPQSGVTRAKLLAGEAWEQAKPTVLASLGLPEGADEHLAARAALPDGACRGGGGPAAGQRADLLRR
ncbi:hypothetical protein M2271_004815 [Streptomyces sp. LBL]|nr:hypothetical protein [Streptomyces sp. LBL]